MPPRYVTGTWISPHQHENLPEIEKTHYSALTLGQEIFLILLSILICLGLVLCVLKLAEITIELKNYLQENLPLLWQKMKHFRIILLPENGGWFTITCEPMPPMGGVSVVTTENQMRIETDSMAPAYVTPAGSDTDENPVENEQNLPSYYNQLVHDPPPAYVEEAENCHNSARRICLNQ